MAQLPLPPGRLRVRAHGHHLRAAGRRERSRSAARPGADRHGVQGASVPASDDRLAVRPADDDARRPVRLLPPLLRAQQRHARDRRRRRHRRGAAAGGASLRQRFRPAPMPARLRTVEPEQTGERRVDDPQGGHDGVPEGRRITRRRSADRGFFPLLVLDAVLTGAKGLNLWSSFRVPPPQRSARLYRALVERGLASSVSGALLPTEQPFLYTVSATATDGHAARGGRGRAARGARPRAPRRASRDGRARRRRRRSCRRGSCSTSDSVTNIAHQLGYFETIASVGRVRRRCRRASTRSRSTRWPTRPRAMLAGARTGRSAGSIRCRSVTSRRLESDWLTSTAPEPRARARPGDARQRRRRHRQARRARRRPSPINLAMRAGSICDPADAPGATHLLSRVIDRGTAHAIGRRDRRGARQPRHHADASRVTRHLLLARLHLPRRGFRAGARAARRHPDGAVAAGERAGDAQGRGRSRRSGRTRTTRPCGRSKR